MVVGLGGYAFRPCLIDISEDTNLSEAVDIAGYRVVGVIWPAALTGSAINYQIDPGDGTFRDVVDASGAVKEVTVSEVGVQNKITELVDLDITRYVGAKFKVNSLTNQAADRLLYLVLEAIGGGGVENLGSYAFRSLLIDDPNVISDPADIAGYQVVAIAYAASMQPANVTFQIDPGDGTFRTVSDVDGTALIHTAVANFSSEIAAVPSLDTVRMIGAQFRIVASADQVADRQCYALLEAIGGQ